MPSRVECVVSSVYVTCIMSHEIMITMYLLLLHFSGHARIDSQGMVTGLEEGA